MSHRMQTASRYQKSQGKDLPCFVDIKIYSKAIRGLPDGTVVKNLPANAGDMGDVVLIPGLRRSPGKRNSDSLQYSYLRNPRDRGAWQATVHRVAKEWVTTQQQTATKLLESESMVMTQDYYIDRKLWKRIKSPEIYPAICKNLIHNKCFTCSEKK